MTINTASSVQEGGEETCKEQGVLSKVVEKLRSSTSAKAGMLALSLSCAQGALANQTTEKEVREQLISMGVAPTEVPHVTIVGTGEKEIPQKLVPKESIFGEEFSVENISSQLEKIAQQMNEEFGSQYISGDWTGRMSEVKPLKDEVNMLNAYVTSLPKDIKPLDAWQAMTSLLALDRADTFADNKALEFILLDNVYRVLKVVKPELAQNAITLKLPKEFDNKTYTYVESNFENITEVNKYLNNKIGAGKMIDWEQNYQEIVTLAREEFKKNAIAEYTSDDFGFTLEEATEMVSDELDSTLGKILNGLKKTTGSVPNPWVETIVDYVPNTAYNHFQGLPGDYNMVYNVVNGKKLSQELDKVTKEGEALDRGLSKLGV